MEPLTVTAIVSALLFKALEKGGEKLGEAVSDKVSQLLTVIQEKFKTEGVEGKLIKVQEDPSDKNKTRFEQELTNQIEDDEDFARNLKALAEELESNEQVKQVFFQGVSIKDSLEIGNVRQENTAKGVPVEQTAFTQVDVGGSVKIGDVSQRS